MASVPARLRLLIACLLLAVAPGLIPVVRAVSGWLQPSTAMAATDEAAGPANRIFVQAMQLLQEADATLDAAKEAQLLRDVDKLLHEIIAKYPDSSLAVKLVTDQTVGDFDYYEFRGRIEALVCNDALSTLCFLHRISEMLPPVETPVSSARWDWLSLSVGYHLMGQPDRAKEIISPFLNAVRRGASIDSSAQDLFVSRALSLIGDSAKALEITRTINDCSTRLYNLADIGKAAKWRGDEATARSVAEEARSFAEAHQCTWEYGLVVQALNRAGLSDAARTLFKRTVDQQVGDLRSRKDGCCAPELAVAAAEIGDPNLALNLLRVVQDENPWAIPAVLSRLAARGQTSLPVAYAEQIPDIDLRGESYAELVWAAMARKDRKEAESIFARLAKLANDSGGRRPALLAQRAKAERALYLDESWRSAFIHLSLFIAMLIYITSSY